MRVTPDICQIKLECQWQLSFIARNFISQGGTPDARGDDLTDEVSQEHRVR